ncbi:hemolysin-III related-domain-containing protein [Xylariaceae sp. FL0016]|nr:hemolysin-III related-domain-containing protein [Xylariaceae sp. FL0016]
MDLASSSAMPLSSSYACSSQQDLTEATTSGASARDNLPRQRRRHSSFGPRRRKSLVNQIMDGEEGLLLRLDLFLSELERRLESLENYSDHIHLDASIAKAFATLQAVREQCSHVSEEFIGAGRRRLCVMVETLDSRYHGALAAAESMNEKARVGIELLESMLTDFETRALKFRDQGYANAAEAAGSIIGEARRVRDEGLERALGVANEGIERAKRAAESVEEHVQRAITRAREHGLLNYEELPVPWRVNPHILKGYRFSETKLGCVRSMFGVSNETVNIWTHALGLLLMLAIAFYFYPTSANFSLYTNTDVFIAAVFLFAACKCLVCSTIWHTMNCVADQTLMERFACIDYTGISLLIAASIMTTEYTAFYCEPVSRWTYITATAVLGIAGTILPWHPKFNAANMAWLRVGFFIGLGATGFMPVFQIIATRGSEWAFEFYTGSNLVKSLAVYVLGALVYASKVPERWWPGAFDYFGNAHNLWHCAVLGGILFHYVAMQEFFSSAFQRAQEGCPAY